MCFKFSQEKVGGGATTAPCKTYLPVVTKTETTTSTIGPTVDLSLRLIFTPLSGFSWESQDVGDASQCRG